MKKILAYSLTLIFVCASLSYATLRNENLSCPSGTIPYYTFIEVYSKNPIFTENEFENAFLNLGIVKYDNFHLEDGKEQKITDDSHASRLKWLIKITERTIRHETSGDDDLDSSLGKVLADLLFTASLEHDGKNIFFLLSADNEVWTFRMKPQTDPEESTTANNPMDSEELTEGPIPLSAEGAYVFDSPNKDVAKSILANLKNILDYQYIVDILTPSAKEVGSTNDSKKSDYSLSAIWRKDSPSYQPEDSRFIDNRVKIFERVMSDDAKKILLKNGISTSFPVAFLYKTSHLQSNDMRGENLAILPSINNSDNNEAITSLLNKAFDIMSDGLKEEVFMYINGATAPVFIKQAHYSQELLPYFKTVNASIGPEKKDPGQCHSPQCRIYVPLSQQLFESMGFSKLSGWGYNNKSAAIFFARDMPQESGKNKIRLKYIAKLNAIERRIKVEKMKITLNDKGKGIEYETLDITKENNALPEISGNTLFVPIREIMTIIAEDMKTNAFKCEATSEYPSKYQCLCEYLDLILNTNKNEKKPLPFMGFSNIPKETMNILHFDNKLFHKNSDLESSSYCE